MDISGICYNLVKSKQFGNFLNKIYLPLTVKRVFLSDLELKYQFTSDRHDLVVLGNFVTIKNLTSNQNGH